MIWADVVRLCGSNNRGALPELVSGIGVVGISDELLCGAVLLGWKVFGTVELPAAGVGDPSDGAAMLGCATLGCAILGCAMLGAAMVGCEAYCGAA